MKMPQDRIERIAALGYTEPEARFLYVVATHSGYFTMRHFNTFTGVSRGKRSMAFAQKLLKHAHATVRDYLGAGSVFHLFSRLVYGPIEKDNVRNRRRHSFDYIRTRLVQMDFLLENPGHDFLETESDKVNLFCESLAVPKDVLPAKVYEGGPGSHPVHWAGATATVPWQRSGVTGEIPIEHVEAEFSSKFGNRIIVLENMENEAVA